MKKIFIVLAAVAAVAACAKSEVEYTASEEITFTPVAKNVTKAMMLKDVFTTTEKFNVWAFYNPTTILESDIDKWVAEYNSADNADVYLDDKTFAYDEGYKLWAGDEAPYFWPKVGSLAFAGYHPTTADATYTLSSTENKMVFSDVVNSWVSAETSNEEDLMYFNLTTGYSKNNVTAVFKHALSWLTINVATTEATVNAGAKISVSNVKFTDVMPNGTGTVNNQEVITWETAGTAGPVETAVPAVDELTTTPVKLKEPLLIPQDMNGNLEITYKITSEPDGSNFTETKVIKLNEMKDSENAALSKWEPAKHYIYNIVIGTEEILIDASVAEWTDVEVPVSVQ